MNNIKLEDSISVEILDSDHHIIGYADSISKASRICHINRNQSVWDYLFKKTALKRVVRTNKAVGVKSKITGKRFHFKLKQ